MNKKYVPILRWKRGEQQALAHLTENVKSKTLPLLEFPDNTDLTKIKNSIEACWKDMPFLFYYPPTWYEEGDFDFPESYTNLITEYVVPLVNDTLGIPVIDLSLAEHTDWGKINRNGIAMRVRNNEFGEIDNILGPLFSNKHLKREETDLILDLQHVTADDLFAKSSVLKAAFTDIVNANEYRSIIIASCSFPKALSALEYGKINKFHRTESEIYELSKKLKEKFDFNYFYADYGPTDLSDTIFVVGMMPNFKIKYTTFDDYLYIKGLSIKKGGLDINNVRLLSQTLVESNNYSGSDFSWGDEMIYKIANGVITSPGNLGTWVGYSMNHHISLMTELI